jgi:hypothetical protein
MNRQFVAFVAVAACSFASGCRSAQLEKDQDCMRGALLDLYTNQIMDNLIRSYNGYPIVQLDYSDITGTVTQNGNASYAGNQNLQTERNEFGVTTLRQFTNIFQYSIGGSQENQLTITANPVLNNNEVYNAYLEFLEKPERLIVSDKPPPQAPPISSAALRPAHVTWDASLARARNASRSTSGCLANTVTTSCVWR